MGSAVTAYLNRLCSRFSLRRTQVLSVLWLLVLAVVFMGYPRYRKCGPVLFETDFEHDFERTPTATRGQMERIPNDDRVGLWLAGGQRSSIQWDLPFEGGRQQLRLRCLMSTHFLVPNTAAHERAIVSVYRIDGNGNHISATPNYGFLEGTKSWQEIDQIVLVPPETRSLKLLVRNLGKSGDMYVDDLSLQPVCDHVDFRILQFLVLVSFAFCVALWYRQLVEGAAPLSLLALFLVGLIVFAAICPRDQIKALSRMTEQVVEALRPAPQAVAQDPAKAPPAQETEQRTAPKFPRDMEEIAALPITKKGHALFFMLLAFVIGLWRRPSFSSLLRCLLALSFLAAATELMQIPEVGRTMSVRDGLIDLIGALLGLLLMWTLRGLWSRLRQRRVVAA